VNERPALGLIIVAGFIGTIFDIPSVFGFAAESFLTIERSSVLIDDDDDELTAELDVEGLLDYLYQLMEPEGHSVMEFLQTMEMPS
jgi:hypothetical protein